MSISEFFSNRFFKRNMKLARVITPYLKNGDKILDFGCGDMSIAKHILSKKRVSIVGLDTVNYNQKEFKFVKHHGGKLPFRSNSFDVVICSFVLHHTDNPEFYLKELKRVSKKRIILLEDVYTNSFEKFFTYFFDWITNKIANWTINVPFNFKSMIEWKRLFKKLKLKLSIFKRIKHPTYLPVKNFLIVLNI